MFSSSPFWPTAAAIALLALQSCTSAVQAQQQTVTRARVFNAITEPAISPQLANIGQSMHMMAVLFPGRATDVTTDLQIRIEASYDGTLWLPISRDVTSAKSNGSIAMTIERANASYPYLRLRALQVPAAIPMTVYYTGSLTPIGQVICDASGCSTAPPASPERITWGLCPAAPCAVTTNITVPFIATRALTWGKCYMAAKIAPTGAPIIFDIRRNGSTIFAGGSSPQLAAGSTATQTHTLFQDRSVSENDQITVDITQVGSTIPGQDVNLTCILN